MDKKIKFLQQVKVKQFAQSSKRHGRNPWGERGIPNYRVITKSENKELDKVFTIIGSTKIQEGFTGYDSEAGYYFVNKNSQKVFMVATGLGRIYKVLPEDIVFLEEEATHG